MIADAEISHDELDALLSVVSAAISLHRSGDKIVPQLLPNTVRLLEQVEEKLQTVYEHKEGVIQVHGYIP